MLKEMYDHLKATIANREVIRKKWSAMFCASYSSIGCPGCPMYIDESTSCDARYGLAMAALNSNWVY